MEKEQQRVVSSQKIVCEEPIVDKFETNMASVLDFETIELEGASQANLAEPLNLDFTGIDQVSDLSKVVGPMIDMDVLFPELTTITTTTTTVETAEIPHLKEPDFHHLISICGLASANNNNKNVQNANQQQQQGSSDSFRGWSSRDDERRRDQDSYCDMMPMSMCCWNEGVKSKKDEKKSKRAKVDGKKVAEKEPASEPNLPVPLLDLCEYPMVANKAEVMQ